MFSSIALNHDLLVIEAEYDLLDFWLFRTVDHNNFRKLELPVWHLLCTDHVSRVLQRPKIGLSLVVSWFAGVVW